MANIRTSSASFALTGIPAPNIELVEQAWSRTNVFGDNLKGVNSCYVTVSDCPNDLFIDVDLEARVELLRCVKHRHDGRSQRLRFRHPDDKDFVVVGGKTRGGQQKVPRRSSWSLFGLDDWERIGKNDITVDGRIPLEDYHYIRSGEVNTLTGVKNVTTPVVSGSKSPPYIFTQSQLNGYRPAYNCHTINGYYAFRISIVNLDGDGTNGDRIVGPMSRVIWVRPSPYPFWPTNRAGYWDGADTNTLNISFENHLNGY